MEIPSPETRPDSFDHYPNIEDWEEVQGGKPTLWLNQVGNNIKVVHVYEDLDASSGKVISTPLTHVDERLVIPEHMRREVDITLENGRLVRFPAFMLLRFHGDPCETRSGESYSRKGVGSDEEVIGFSQLTSYRDAMRSKGYAEYWTLPNRDQEDSKYIFTITPKPKH